MDPKTSLNFNSEIKKKEEKPTEAMGTVAEASEKKPVLFTPVAETAGIVASSNDASETAGSIATSNSGSTGSFNATA